MASRCDSWPRPVQALAVAIDAAVSAARAGDLDRFTDALGDLARVDREQLGVLMGSVARELIERAYPDGFDAGDAEEVLDRTARRSAAWYPRLDPDALVPALTGALSVSVPDDEADAAVVVTHGLLLVADLLDARNQPLEPLLDAALRELMREQTMELP